MSFFYDDPSEHPDAIVLEIAGKEVDWLLNKSAFEQAQDEGIDLQEFDEVEEDDIQGNLDALATLLYIGTIPFREAGEETPSLEDLDRAITPTVAAQVGPEVMAQFQGLTDEEIEDVMGKE